MNIKAVEVALNKTKDEIAKNNNSILVWLIFGFFGFVFLFVYSYSKEEFMYDEIYKEERSKDVKYIRESDLLGLEKLIELINETKNIEKKIDESQNCLKVDIDKMLMPADNKNTKQNNEFIELKSVIIDQNLELKKLKDKIQDIHKQIKVHLDLNNGSLRNEKLKELSDIKLGSLRLILEKIDNKERKINEFRSKNIFFKYLIIIFAFFLVFLFVYCVLMRDMQKTISSFEEKVIIQSIIKSKEESTVGKK